MGENEGREHKDKYDYKHHKKRPNMGERKVNEDETTGYNSVNDEEFKDEDNADKSGDGLEEQRDPKSNLKPGDRKD